MLSRPLVCWAAGMVKIPLITARRPAVRCDHVTYDAYQMNCADRVALASWDRRLTRR